MMAAKADILAQKQQADSFPSGLDGQTVGEAVRTRTQLHYDTPVTGPLVTKRQALRKRGVRMMAINAATWASQGKFKTSQSRLKHFTPTYQGNASLTITTHSVLNKCDLMNSP